MRFRKILFEWYVSNKRNLPWRNTNDPYFIWLSEIILQQTKVEQGLPYYLIFIKEFPTISDLANAKEDKVLKLWQGLGYYSRARNLHFSAQYIMDYYNGVFPKNYNDILALKGVGIYTAAAISSFSFGLPYAVVDGNVVRFLSRFFGIEIPSDSFLGKKKYQELAQDLLDTRNPADHNQAMMEFGAIQCLPKNPKCHACVFIADCVAYSTNNVQKLPVKLKKVKIKKRFLHYLLIQNNDLIILGKRKNGIWKGLYEFPFIEFSSFKLEKKVINSAKWALLFKNTSVIIEAVSDQFIHKLSHQHLYAKFWILNVEDFELEGYSFIRKSELKYYPISRLMDKFLKEKNII